MHVVDSSLYFSTLEMMLRNNRELDSICVPPNRVVDASMCENCHIEGPELIAMLMAEEREQQKEGGFLCCITFSDIKWYMKLMYERIVHRVYHLSAAPAEKQQLPK